MLYFASDEDGNGQISYGEFAAVRLGGNVREEQNEEEMAEVEEEEEEFFRSRCWWWRSTYLIMARESEGE